MSLVASYGGDHFLKDKGYKILLISFRLRLIIIIFIGHIVEKRLI